jgi:hypothetical protein
MADVIADTLRRVRTSKVEVMLSEPNVVSDIQYSGFWPRVTIEIPGKSRTFPLTSYKDIKKKSDDGELSELEREILILVSGSSKTLLHKANRKRELKNAVARINGVISRAITKAAAKTPMIQRHAAASRQYRKKRFLKNFQDFCARNGRDIQFDDIRPSEIGEAWNDYIRNKIARDVMDS